MTAPAMTLSTALRLGRVSNLPTVWSNALAGACLAGTAVAPGATAPLPPIAMGLLIAAMSCTYVAGMFLNDAFDADWDRKRRPDRPIPAGDVAAATVFCWGFGLLAASVVLLAIAGAEAGVGAAPASAVALLLGGTVILYDRHHKGNPLGPVVMGLCRVWIYVSAATLVLGTVPPATAIGAALLLCHLIGLTYAAKQEDLARIDRIWPLALLAVPPLAMLTRIDDMVMAALELAFVAAILGAARLLFRRAPGDTPSAVAILIASIALLDALLIASTGANALALSAACCFPATLALQRLVRGT